MAALVCAGPVWAQEEGELRLRDGAVEHEGRLEVFRVRTVATSTTVGEWGTVCDDGWVDAAGTANGDVACRQLGYSGGVVEFHDSAYFGEGTGPILLDDVSCDGNESRLIDCRHRGLGNHNCGHNEDVGVTCWNPAIVVSEDALFVAEADTAGSTYDIVLERQPTSDVMVTVGGTQGTDVTVSPTALTYTTANWNRARTVTVTAAEDADAVDDTVTLTHSASGGGYDSASVDVAVTVYDDDGANRAPSFGEGVSATRSVAENTPSGGSVGAPVSATDADDDPLTYSLLGTDAAHFAIVATDGQIQTSGALDHEQGVVYRVTVRVADDAGHEDTIRIVISVTDVDEPPTAPSAPRAHSQTSTSLTVTWNAPPDGDRPAAESYDLQYRPDDGSAFAAGPQAVAATTATITGLVPGTAYEVQVRAKSDEGTGPWSASATLRTTYSPGEEGDLALRDGADDSEGWLSVFLNGSWGTVCDDGWGDPPDYSDGYPNAEVACRQLGFRRALEVHDASRFGPGTGRILLDDLSCDGTESRLIDCQHRGIGNSNCSHSEDVGLVCDATDPPSVSVSPQILTVAEGDAEGSRYGIVLDVVPSGDVVVTVDGTSGTDVTATSTVLTFTTTDWAQRQTVTVTAAHDADADNDPVTLSHSATGGGYDGVSIPSVAVTVIDDEGGNQAPRFDEESPASRTVAENSTPGQLVGAPVSATDDDGGTLTYSLVGGDTALFDIVASSGQLRVNGALDHEQSTSHGVTVRVDDDAGGFAVIEVDIDVSDVDEPPSAPGPPTVSNLTATSATFRWDPPADSGRPAIEHYDLQYLADGDAAFTAGPQDVLVSTATIAGFVPSTDYEIQVRAVNHEGDGAWSASATFRTPSVDGTALGTVRLSANTLSVAEGDTEGGQYEVELSAEPSAAVVVTIGGTAGTDLTARPSTLTYTVADWNQSQTVTVTAAEDADAQDDEATLTHTSTGGGYDDASNPTVAVTVTDNDGANQAPSFDDGAATSRSVAENSPAGSPVGAPVSATDADDDPLTYSLFGTDAAHFGVTATSSQILVNSPLDHEQGIDYRVSVRVEDGEGGSDTISVEITVGDVDEPPSAPSTPRVTATTANSATFAWDPPGDLDRPPVDDYDLQYRVGTTGTFTAGPQGLTGTTGTISGLVSPTHYQVQVRANNAEGAGVWSSSLTYHFDPATAEGDLRLSGGSDDAEGRVEVVVGGVWGTVCDDGWDALDGRVACRQAGFVDVVRVRTAAHFGEGTGPINLDDVACIGTEARLIDCPHTPEADHDCGHYEDAGVTCLTMPTGWVSPAELTVVEGDAGGGQYEIGLDYQPVGDTVVTVGGTSGSDVTVNPSMLTYTTANWDQAQTVTVTAADDADADDDPVTLTHSATGGGYEGGIPDVEVTVADDDGANASPSFDEGVSTTRNIAENSSPSSPIGSPVSAQDDDGDPLTYSLLGADAAHFDIDAGDGQLLVDGGLDHEQGITYRVTVRVEDDMGNSDTINVAIDVGDVDEPPNAPSAPSIAETSGTSLNVRWEEPPNSGRPAIDDYDLQYRTGDAGAFEAGPQGVARTRATITGLVYDTEYQIQVRANNDEGEGAWSPSVSGRTDPEPDANLKGLTVSDGDGAATLMPAFDPAVTSYTAEVANTVTVVSIHAEPNHVKSTVATATPEDLDPDTAGIQMRLAVGDNVMTLEILAEDGETKTYTITVIRAPYCAATTPAVTGVTGSPSAGLIDDCNTLMAWWEAVVGGQDPPSLDWSPDRSMRDWMAIETSDGRVTAFDSDLETDLYSTSLRGELTPELGSLSALTVLRLSGVGLRGPIPEELGNLSQLTVLDLSNNRSVVGIDLPGLSGTIPDSLGNLAALTELDLGSNSLSGEIPDSLQRLVSLRVLRLGRNVEVSVYQQPISDTGLEGFFPDWFGSLTRLEVLRLDFNRLDGRIPRELGDLQSLVELSLERNYLRGCVPRSLSRFRSDIATQRERGTVVPSTLPYCPAPGRTTANVTSALDGEVAVNYRAGVPSGGQTISHFEYRLSSDGGVTWNPDWSTIPDSGPGQSSRGSYVFRGLANGTTYQLEIRAVNDDGAGNPARVTATPRPRSSDAALLTLEVIDTASGATVALTPTFDPASLHYATTVRRSIATVTVFAVPADGNAGLSTEPGDDDAGRAGIQVPLEPGFNEIALTVTAQDGATQVVYRLSVLRERTNDPAGVEVDPPALTIEEGKSASYAVKLTAEPVESVTVAVNATGIGQIETNPSRLTFTTFSWGTAQTVEVTAQEDDDSVDGYSVLSHVATGSGYERVTTSDVTVDVFDDDVDGVVISTTMLAVNEGSQTTYTVVLDTEPVGTVEVTATAPSGSGLTVDPGRLVFTPADWGTARTMTVEAEQDADGEDDAATVTHAVSGGGYDGVSVDSVRTTVLDDDTKGVDVSTSELNIRERGSAVYTLVLTTEPTGPVTVTATAPPGSDLNVAPSAVTFSPTDWMTVRTVTVTVAGDDDAVDETATVTHVASGGGYGAVDVPGVAVAVEDADAPQAVFSTTHLGVAENAETDYTVRLVSAPRATMTMSVAVPTGADLTVRPAEIVITTTDWSTPRTVAVAAGDDADTADDEVTLRHTASGAGYDGDVLGVVNVTVTDDDTPGVVVWATRIDVPEGGSATYNIRLSTQPTAPVTVTATASGELDVAPAVLSFTVADWDTTQIVTIRAPHDDDTVDGLVTVRHAARGGDYDGVPVPDTVVSVIDDDIAGVTFSATSVSVAEGDTTTYTVVLDALPDAPVTVTTSVAAGASIAVRPAVLTFTAADWAAAQMVTIEALQDDDGEDTRETVTHTVGGGAYDGVALAAVAVNVADDDVLAVDLSTNALSIREGGEGTYAVSLATEPTGPVTVTPSAPVGADLSVEPAALTFDAANWAIAQNITVHAAHDEDTAADQASVSHVASGGGYGGVAVESVSVAVVDDDRAGVALSTGMLTVGEGGTATYTVRLDTEPSSAVILTASVVSGSGIDLRPSSVTFAIDDWALGRTITVDAAEDSDADDGAASIAHQARGGGYDGVQVATLPVAVMDNDTPPVPVDARARADRLTLRFDRMLDESSVPEPGAFDVQVDGNDGSGADAAEPANVADVGVAASTVVLTLARAVQPGEDVTVTYTPGNRRIRSAGQIYARGFTIRARLPARGGEVSGRVPLFESAANADRQGFVRVISHSEVAGEVDIEAVDDNGMRAGPVTLSIAAGGAAHFNSDDLEGGNTDKGLPNGIGQPGQGNWRLLLTSDLDIEVLSYARTSDGFVTSLHDVVPVEAGVHRGLVFFNPGENVNQESRLRLVNSGDVDASVTVTGIDDLGTESEEVRIHLPAGSAIDLTASELEAGTGPGIEGGALGDGEGKWQLEVVSDTPIVAMSLLASQGRLTNLSTAPQTPGSAEGSVTVPLFPSVSNPDLQGFVRVINQSAQAGNVLIEAFDDTDTTYETVILSIDAGAAAQFNSDDLELGNPDKGLAGSTGAGEGAWRLELSSELDIEVLGYIRTDDGFVTAMHDLAPIDDDVYRVVFLNPASNDRQVSRLRLINPGTIDAAVTLTGIDSDGISPGDPVRATVPAGASLELTSVELESGDSEDIEGGAFGDGAGKWQVRIESDEPIWVMSLLRSPTGHLTNLSTSPRHEAESTVVP